MEKDLAQLDLLFSYKSKKTIDLAGLEKNLQFIGAHLQTESPIEQNLRILKF